eukprot:1156931-Pelagomonas_calceolata.AAC.17
MTHRLKANDEASLETIRHVALFQSCPMDIVHTKHVHTCTRLTASRSTLRPAQAQKAASTV